MTLVEAPRGTPAILDLRDANKGQVKDVWLLPEGGGVTNVRACRTAAASAATDRPKDEGDEQWLRTAVSQRFVTRLSD
jgi:hypothetical protein